MENLKLKISNLTVKESKDIKNSNNNKDIAEAKNKAKESKVEAKNENISKELPQTGTNGITSNGILILSILLSSVGFIIFKGKKCN